ncbi:MAG: hypothetical protein DCC65_01165 [Planctomycetota bacterium]|nr:MAG: hypothetical protein DCC65_01165 [Planctomycetota bacterium]
MSKTGTTPITELLAACSHGDAAARDLLFNAVYDELRKIARSQLPHAAGHTLQPTALVHEAYLRLYKGVEGGGFFHSRKHFFAAAAKAMRHFLVDDVRRKGRVKRGGPGVGDDGRVAPFDFGAPAGDKADADAHGTEARDLRVSAGDAGSPGGNERKQPVPKDSRRVETIDIRPARVHALRDDEPVYFDADHGNVLAIDEALRKLEAVAPRPARVVELRYFGGFSVEETAEALDISARTVDGDWQIARAWLGRELAGL